MKEKIESYNRCLQCGRGTKNHKYCDHECEAAYMATAAKRAEEDASLRKEGRC